MAYTVELSRANRSCILFLINQSASMSEAFGEQQNKTRMDAVADSINRLLHTLVLRCASDEGVTDMYDLGVIGYEHDLSVGFGGELAGCELVPISDVADHPIRVEDRSVTMDDGAGGIIEQQKKVTVHRSGSGSFFRWNPWNLESPLQPKNVPDPLLSTGNNVQPVNAYEKKFPVWFEAKTNGATPMTHVFQEASRILRDWLPDHAAALSPIVINITDGDSTDGDPTSAAEAVAGLATEDGNALVFNCHLSSTAAIPVVFPGSDEGLTDDFARRLFQISSALPPRTREEASAEGYDIAPASRGFVFNSDLVQLIGFLDIGTRATNVR